MLIPSGKVPTGMKRPFHISFISGKSKSTIDQLERRKRAFGFNRQLGGLRRHESKRRVIFRWKPYLNFRGGDNYRRDDDDDEDGGGDCDDRKGGNEKNESGNPLRH